MSDDAFPTYTEAEVFADRCVHAVGVTAGFIAAITLVIVALKQLPTDAATAVVIYALGMLAMFCFSAAYNLSRGPKRWLLRRCDHAAIFAMIAGSYTPFTLLSWSDGWSGSLTTIIWALALCGIALKFLAPARGLRTLSALPYLLLGWIGLSAIFPLLTTLGPQTFSLIVLGGLFYSVGVLFHVWDSLPFQNAIWHGFVLAGAATHYIAILNGVVLAPTV